MLDAWINRRDCHGGYGKNGRPYTAKDKLTEAVLTAHVAGRITVGVHAIGLDQTCKWACWDIDAHDGERETENHAAAVDLVGRLKDAGYAPLVEDSDGRGGRHVWVFFEEPAPAADVHALGAAFPVDAEDWEFFPKQPAINPEPDERGHFGSWVRLPGKHHKRDHWSRVRALPADWVDWGDGVAEWMEDPQVSPAPPAAPKPRAPAGVGREGVYAEGAEPLALGSAELDWHTALKCLPLIGEPHLSDYDDWVKVGMAIHRVRPTMVGLGHWDEWSSRSPKYQPDACAEKWASFGNHPNPVGVGTLVKWAGLDVADYAIEALGPPEKVNETTRSARGEEERRAVLEQISEVIGVRLERIVQRGREVETHGYYVAVGGVEREIGPYDALMSERDWRRFLSVCFGLRMRPVGKDKWAKLAPHFLRTIEVDDSPEHSAEGRAGALLGGFLDEHPAQDWDNRCLNEPVRHKGCLWVHFPTLVGWIYARRMWHPKKSMLAFCQALGFKYRKTVKFEAEGRWTTRSYWGCPVDNEVVKLAYPEDVEPEDEADEPEFSSRTHTGEK